MNWRAIMRGEATELHSHNSHNPQNSTDTPNIANIENIAKGVERCDPELMARVSDACKGLTIASQQFIALLTEEDKHLIIEGKFEGYTLRAYAKSFSAGIQAGRITFHPTFHHGIPNTKQYKA